MLKILGIGDNVCDKYRSRKMMYPGGQALNVAVYASRLGAAAGYMGVFGDDAAAAHIQDTLRRLGIDTSHCRQYPGENGYAVVDFKDGDRYFVTSNKGGVVNQHPLSLNREDLSYIAGFDHIHTSENGHTDHLLPALRSTGRTLSYDFSIRWNKPGGHLERVAPYIDVAFLSCGNSGETAESIIRLLLSRGCGSVLATRGSQGAVFGDGEQFFYQPPHLVEPVDTLGAGDSFAAAFLTGCTKARLADPEAFRDRSSAYYRAAVRRALEEAAEFSARICLVDGAFGYGVPYED